MATAPKQTGIMALPENESMNQGPQLSPMESYDAVTTALATTSPETATQYEQTMNMSLPPELLSMSSEEIGQLLQLFQYLQENPDQYASAIAELIKDDVIDEGDLPAEYDEEVLATVIALLMQAMKTKQGPMVQAPQGFAMGGIADAARAVASQGRSGDTILAHITPAEAAMLRQQGGMGTINPVTGLREYGLLKKIFRGAVNVVKSVVKPIVNIAKEIVSSPLGRIVATVALTTILGPAAAAYGLGSAGTAALVSGGLTALSGGDLKQVLTSSAVSFLGAPGGPVGEFLGGATGVTSVAGRAALASTAAGTAAGLLGGKSLKDSVKGGLQQAAIGVGTAVGLNYMSQPVGTRDLSTAIKDTFASPPPSDTIGGKVYEPEVLTPEEVAAGKAAPIENRNMPRAPGGNVAPVTTGDSFPSRAGIEPPISLKTQPASGAPSLVPGASPVGGYRPNMNPMAQAAQNTPPVVPVESGIGSLFNTVKTGAENLYQGGKDLYNEYLSPSGIASRGEPAAQQAGMDALAKLPKDSPEWMQKAVYEKAVEAAQPGMLAQYGPLTAAGLGSLALMGGFEQGDMPDSPLREKLSGTPGLDLIKQDPREYLVQNMRGVKYNPDGSFAGYVTPPPSASSNPNPYLNYYTPRSRPRFAAQGGIMNVRGYASGGTVTRGGYANGGEVNLAAQLTPQSTPAEIAAAYQQFLAARGSGDTPEAKVEAVNYLRNKGIQDATTQQAYLLYQQNGGKYDYSGNESAQTVPDTGVGNLSPLKETNTPLTAATPSPYSGVTVTRPAQEKDEVGYQQYYSGRNRIRYPMVPSNMDFISAVLPYSNYFDMLSLVNRGSKIPTRKTVIPEVTPYIPNYSSSNAAAYTAPTAIKPVEPKPLTANEQLVLEMYGKAGRSGFGDERGAIDQSGFNYWVDELNTGDLNAANLRAAFDVARNEQYANQGLGTPTPLLAARGGIAQLAQSGYPRRTGQISGPGTEKSDSIPAMLSDGEFVMTAKAVRGAGGGSRRAGAKKMYDLMHQLEQNAARG